MSARTAEARRGGSGRCRRTGGVRPRGAVDRVASAGSRAGPSYGWGGGGRHRGHPGRDVCRVVDDEAGDQAPLRQRDQGPQGTLAVSEPQARDHSDDQVDRHHRGVALEVADEVPDGQRGSEDVVARRGGESILERTQAATVDHGQESQRAGWTHGRGRMLDVAGVPCRDAQRDVEQRLAAHHHRHDAGRRGRAVQHRHAQQHRQREEDPQQHEARQPTVGDHVAGNTQEEPDRGDRERAGPQHGCVDPVLHGSILPRDLWASPGRGRSRLIVRLRGSAGCSPPRKLLMGQHLLRSFAPTRSPGDDAAWQAPGDGSPADETRHRP